MLQMKSCAFVMIPFEDRDLSASLFSHTQMHRKRRNMSDELLPSSSTRKLVSLTTVTEWAIVAIVITVVAFINVSSVS